MRGKFIVIEGLDGSGKGTQIERLSAALSERGIPVHTTAEPTDGHIGEQIRKMLKNSENINIYLQAALFFADRIDHITHAEHGIRAYLDRGITVICDRFYYSTLAYQGINENMKWLMDMVLDAPVMITPDLCIFYDASVEACMERIKQRREKLELFEDAATLQKVQYNFHAVLDVLKEREEIKIINANRDVDAIANETLDIVMEVLNK